MDNFEAFASNIYARTKNDYSFGTAHIHINQSKCKDYNKLIEAIKTFKNKRYIPKIEPGREAEYLMTHEFAHTLINFKRPLKASENFVGIDYNRVKSIRNEITKIYEEYLEEVSRLEKAFKDAELELIMGKRTDIATVQALKQDYDAVFISKYSLSDVDEFMAEAFTDYKLNKTPTSTSKKVGGILDKYFKKP